MQNFRLSTAHVKFHQICTLIVWYKFSAIRGQRSYVSWPWRVMENLEKSWHVVSEITRIWRILTRALKSLANLHFDWFLLSKVFNIWPKRYRGVIFYYTKEWCKTSRKNDLWFGKWQEEYGKFSPEHWKVSELGLSWDPFVQSRKCMSLTFTEELCVMTMRNGTQIEVELTCLFNIDMRNLMNFDPSTWKSSKFAL